MLNLNKSRLLAELKENKENNKNYANELQLKSTSLDSLKQSLVRVLEEKEKLTHSKSSRIEELRQIEQDNLVLKKRLEILAEEGRELIESGLEFLETGAGSFKK